MSQQDCHFDASSSLTALEQDSTIIAVILTILRYAEHAEAGLKSIAIRLTPSSPRRSSVSSSVSFPAPSVGWNGAKSN
jgi:hypothetical protein